MQDKNVAEWDTLSKEEQDKRLASRPGPPPGAPGVPKPLGH